ncbi:hypothetical protein [Paenibacillus cellulositrophicus]
MDWLKRMNHALEYIETHLSEEIDYDQVAGTACCMWPRSKHYLFR